MKSISALSLLLLAFWACTLAKAEVEREDIVEAFKTNEIIPDVIDTSPEELVYIKFGREKVMLGNELTPSQAEEQPYLAVSWNADPDKLYLLAMIDPDAPSRRIHALREINHWLVGNIALGDVEKGELLASYLPPGPPPASGLHRYIFLIYEQPGKILFDEQPITSKSSHVARVRFSIRKFAEKYHLGQPIAGNFFQAKHDSAATMRKMNDYIDFTKKRLKSLFS